MKLGMLCDTRLWLVLLAFVLLGFVSFMPQQLHGAGSVILV